MIAYIKTLASVVSIAASAALLHNGNVAHAWDGSVTLYDDAHFQGSSLQIKISTSQRCFNVECFGDRASSVKWEGLPTTGNFGRFDPPHIAFFTHNNCEGPEGVWLTTSKHFPEDLRKDRINDRISSFMILQHWRFKSSGTFDVPCPRSMFGLDGNDSVTTVSEREMIPTEAETAVEEPVGTPANASKPTVGPANY